MYKFMIAVLIIAIMVVSGLLGVYVYDTNKYETWGLAVNPVYDFTISISEGMQVFQKIGSKANWMNGIVDFSPTQLVKVTYTRQYQGADPFETFIIIYAPIGEDFNNLTLNRYYKIYGVDYYDNNIKEIIQDGYNYICPYYQNMTSRWWWIVNMHNNPDYNKLVFTYSGLTDGTGIEPTNQWTYTFIDAEPITTSEIAQLNIYMA